MPLHWIAPITPHLRLHLLLLNEVVKVDFELMVFTRQRQAPPMKHVWLLWLHAPLACSRHLKLPATKGETAGAEAVHCLSEAHPEHLHNAGPTIQPCIVLAIRS